MTRSNQSRADEVYESLRYRILNGELTPNERLIEQTIAADAGVSRTPVREALHRLEVDGLVESKGRSIVVAGLSAEDLSELGTVRESLEGLAARLAALARSDIDVATLERLVADSEEAVASDDVARFVEINHAFHEVIWTSARNRYLARQLALLRSLIERRQTTTLASRERRAEALIEHAAIVRAVIARDPDSAEAAARAHFRNALTIRILNAHLANQPSGMGDGADKMGAEASIAAY
jgi:DNA-binding GntR family transcriptional regulator